MTTEATTTEATTPHQTLVARQFGAHARAYVESRDHAQGADLDRLATLAAARPGARALDLGCGGGHVSFTLAPFVQEVVAYDLSPDMLDAVREIAAQRGLSAITSQQGAAERLPFADASFDIVATRYSAHHWSDLTAGLAEMRRVLKPDGLVVVMDVVTPGVALLDTYLQSLELLRDPSHVRNYSLAEWREALRGAGLRPGDVHTDRLRLSFAPWIARLATPPVHVDAIRALQALMPVEARDHFALEADGTFTVDTATITATL